MKHYCHDVALENGDDFKIGSLAYANGNYFDSLSYLHLIFSLELDDANSLHVFY
jgi:hypothetical protein